MKQTEGLPIDVRKAILRIFDELLHGPSPEAAWVLNPNDPGILRSLDNLSAEQASSVGPSGGPSVAAHVDHLRYGLELLNRWIQGENPFADANYSASWERNVVTEVEWASRREALQKMAEAWRHALERPRPLSEFELLGIVSSVTHFAYHVGAIRQIARSARGPAAPD